VNVVALLRASVVSVVALLVSLLTASVVNVVALLRASVVSVVALLVCLY